MQKKWSIFLMGIFVLFALTGCQNQTPLQSTGVLVDQEGAIEGTIVSSFTESFFELEELKALILEEIDEYNMLEGEDRISLTEAVIREEDVVVRLQYASYKDYSSYNEVPFFVGTLEEAVAEGYSFGEQLYEDVEDMSQYTIVIWNEEMTVAVPSKIRFFGDGVALNGKKAGTSVGSEVEGPYFVVFK